MMCRGSGSSKQLWRLTGVRETYLPQSTQRELGIIHLVRVHAYPECNDGISVSAVRGLLMIGFQSVV